MHGTDLTPELVLAAYARGLFPMAEKRDDPHLYWVSPEKRGVIPLDGFHVPHRLARTVRSGSPWRSASTNAGVAGGASNDGGTGHWHHRARSPTSAAGAPTPHHPTPRGRRVTGSSPLP